MLSPLVASLLLSALPVPLPQPPLLTANFDTGADGFVYADDAFRNTRQPNYADGKHVKTGGFRGGALRVTLGGRDNIAIFGMSGGWKRTFSVPDLGARELELELRFRINQTADYGIDEFSQALASIDGRLVGRGE